MLAALGDDRRKRGWIPVERAVSAKAAQTSDSLMLHRSDGKVHYHSMLQISCSNHVGPMSCRQAHAFVHSNAQLQELQAATRTQIKTNLLTRSKREASYAGCSCSTRLPSLEITHNRQCETIFLLRLPERPRTAYHDELARMQNRELIIV